VRRIRWLKREEADRLLGILPPHQAALVRFSLATGLRERNVTRLEWSQVDLTRRVAWIHPDQAKAKKPIGVPLNDEAMVALRAEEGKHDKRVFTWQGRPIDKANTRAWRRALKEVGIKGIVDRIDTLLNRQTVNSTTPVFFLNRASVSSSVDVSQDGRVDNGIAQIYVATITPEV
jgi:integrase